MKLKTCPFCGGTPYIFEGHNRGFDYYQCICEKCIKSGETKLTKEQAITAWNERMESKC